MTSKEIVDALLRLVEILTAWPIIILLTLLIFRRSIGKFLPALIQRLTKAEVVGTTFEFSPVAVNALQDAIEKGAEELKDKPEQLAGFVREQVKKLPEFQAATPATSQPNLTGCSILWVDDNPLNNVYESSVLRQYGTSIMFARSTEEARAFLRQNNFDLIISDVGRIENGRNNYNAGYELLEELTQRNQDIPLIFYTSSMSRLNSNRSRSAYGAADSPTELLKLVVTALEKR